MAVSIIRHSFCEGDDTIGIIDNSLFGSLSKLRELNDDGIIDSETAQQLMKTKKERILQKYPPRQASAGYWYVNIRFAPGKDGKKMLKRNKREDLENDIIVFVGENGLDSDFKRKNNKCYKYKNAFAKWLKAQQYKNKNTELRNQREYNRFFVKTDEGRELAEMDIRKIKASQIEEFMLTAIKTYNLSIRKALEDYRMFFKSVYQQAVADMLIAPDKNPCLFIIEKRFLQFGRDDKDISAEERIIPDEIMDKLHEAADRDIEKRRNYMPPLAFKLAALTGMRAGELGGLMWKNIDMTENNVIYVVQSQKYDQSKKKYYISDTKNKKKRCIPITDEIREILLQIKAVQDEYGKTDDYVFSTAKGFSSNRQLGDYLQNKRIQLKLDHHVSIHAERRTLNSKMAAQGVSETIRASILGHTPRVNQQNYTYDMMSLDQKREIISNASKRA